MFRSLVKDLEKKIIDLTAEEYEARPFSLEGALVAASHLYRAGVGFRLGLYRSGILKPRKLPCPVISIGNITAGGTGKTPMAIYLAEYLSGRGCRPVVVSRGYGGASGRSPGIAGDGMRVLMHPDAAGDEPHMMAQRKRFPVVVGSRRYDAGMLAVDTFDPDLIILDDGFQHLALARDVDIVLLDHNRPLGNGRMLPAGRLRETMAMASPRIDAVVLTRCPGPVNRYKTIHTGNVPVFSSRHEPFLAGVYPRETASKQRPGLGWLTGKKAVLVSAIARNDAFAKTVSQLGAEVVDHLEFQDHYRYKKSDFEEIRERARDARVILTTEKDWVKMDHSFDWGRDLAVIGIRIIIDAPERLGNLIASRLNL